MADARETILGLPFSVDIRVLGACNLRCPFCFGPRHGIRAEGFDAIVCLLPRLRDHGVTTIVITGGEPLLLKRLPCLLRAAKHLGLQVVLSTNGTLVERRHADILPFLDWIALPLDGQDAATHNAARPGTRASFDAVLASIALVRHLYPSVKIKLGTVIHRLNADQISGIPQILSKTVGAPDIWKIYQTSYSNYAADNRETLNIPQQKFETASAIAVAVGRAYGWNTTVYRNDERDGKYLFIEPNGDAMVIADGDEKVIGNFLSDFNNVLVTWSSYIHPGRLRSNVEVTYARTGSTIPR